MTEKLELIYPDDTKTELTTQQFHLDSQQLNGFEKCPMFYYHSYVRHLKPKEKPKAFDKGTLVHRLLEFYYASHPKLHLEAVHSKSFLKTFPINIHPREPIEILEISKRFLPEFYSDLKLDPSDIEQIYSAFVQYVKHNIFHYQSIECIESIEQSALGRLIQILINNKELLDIIWVAKNDLILSRQLESGSKELQIYDHKSQSRTTYYSKYNNQFMGYMVFWNCLVENSNRFVINVIGLQKTIPPSEKFRRIEFALEDQEVRYWLQNTAYKVEQMYEIKKLHEQRSFEDDFDPNDEKFEKRFNQCGNCWFVRTCHLSKGDNKKFLEEQLYDIEIWDPTKDMEVEV